MVQQKFSKRQGMLLKHYIDKNLPLNSEKTVLRYQKEIMEAAGKILGLSER